MMLGTKGAAVSRSMVFNEMSMHETRDSREGRWMSEFFSSNNMRSFMSMHECVRSHMRPCPCQCQCLKKGYCISLISLHFWRLVGSELAKCRKPFEDRRFFVAFPQWAASSSPRASRRSRDNPSPARGSFATPRLMVVPPTPRLLLMCWRHVIGARHHRPHPLLPRQSSCRWHQQPLG